MFRNINISVTGGGNDERELISNVITTALVSEGYSNVALVNTIGEPMVGSDVPSLRDVLKKHHPDFLEKQVRVWSIPVADGIEMSKADVQEVAKNPDTRVFATLEADMDGYNTTIAIAEGKFCTPANKARNYLKEFDEDNGYGYGSPEHIDALKGEGYITPTPEDQAAFEAKVQATHDRYVSGTADPSIGGTLSAASDDRDEMELYAATNTEFGGPDARVNKRPSLIEEMEFLDANPRFID